MVSPILLNPGLLLILARCSYRSQRTQYGVARIQSVESPQLEYIKSWKINPDKEPDLHYDDWHQGFSDATDFKFPSYPANIPYMMGWMQALGMQAGYDSSPPAINEKNYLEGYSQGKYERECH